MKQIITIGFEKEMVANSEETKKQIEYVKNFELDIYYKDQKIKWDQIYDPKEPQSILQSIVTDRSMRVDKKTIMANRPPFAAIMIDEGKIVRLEFYEGHDFLSLGYDFRSKDLQNQNLERYHSEG
jgi:hypothetical protein